MSAPALARVLGLAAVAVALTVPAAPLKAQSIDRTFSGACTASVRGEADSERVAPATFQVQAAAPDFVATGEEFSLSSLRVRVTSTALRQVIAGRAITALEGGTTAYAALEGGEPYSSGNASETGVRAIDEATVDQLIAVPGSGVGSAPVQPFWRWRASETAGDQRVVFRGVTAYLESRPASTASPSVQVNVDCRIPPESAQTLAIVQGRAGLPRVTRIAPAQGLALIPSIVTITGQNLRGVRRVAFGRAGTSSVFIVDSPTRIRVLTPGLPPGRWPVSVQVSGYDSIGTTAMPAYLEISPWPVR